MDRGAWRATVHGVAKSWTQLTKHAQTHYEPGPSQCFVRRGRIKNTLVLLEVRVVKKVLSKELTLELSFSVYSLCLDHSYLLCCGTMIPS